MKTEKMTFNEQSKLISKQKIIKITSVLISKLSKKQTTVAGANIEIDRATSTKTKIKIYNEFSNMFTGIGCFKGNFSLSLKDAMPYQVPPGGVAYTQEPFRKELERLQEEQILGQLGVDKPLNGASFIVVPKPNGTVQLCLDPARLNKPLIWPIHRKQTLNDILPKLPNVCYMTKIDTSSWYHNLK